VKAAAEPAGPIGHSEAVGELIHSAEKSVGACRELCRFLDQNPVLNNIEINRSAAVRREARNLAFAHKPSEALLSVLSAARAAQGQDNSFGGGAFGHYCKFVSVKLAESSEEAPHFEAGS
jgi:hypothetical protein